MENNKLTSKAKVFQRVCLRCDKIYRTKARFSKICPKCRKMRKDYGVVKSPSKRK